MKLNVKSLLAATLMSVTAANSINAKQKLSEKEHPNVLMFVVDDWGAYDLSLSGSKLYETPNIDRLANRSTVFNQGYVAYPRSVPSRYSLITGRHCARPQQGAHQDDRKVDASSYCIAMPFKNAGYQTFIIGKWHLSDKVTSPTDKGFDISIGAGHAGATQSYFAPFNKEGVTNSDKLIQGMDDAQPGEYLTDYMTRKTVDYIKGTKNSKKPFFAVCSYYAVHTPLEAKREMIEKFEKKLKNMNLGPDPMAKEEAGDTKTQQDHPVYAAMIESVDESVGKILGSLKEAGKMDNTIIVLISDHGGLSNRGNKRELATTNRPLKAGKGHLYEGGLRVPFLIHTPKQSKRYDSNTPVVSLDLLPTLADMCNAPVDPTAELDGVSLKNLVNSHKSNFDLHRNLYWHKAAERPQSTGDYVSSAIRKGDYKLIDFYTQGRVELYNVVTDPGEHHNLFNEQPQLASQLMNQLNQWRTDVGVKMAKTRDKQGQKKGKSNKRNKQKNK